MFKKILFVCVGNICRSPSAEVLMRHALHGREVQISSAGLGALVGHGIDPMAQELLKENGLDASTHMARQITSQIVAEADLVLVMERKHLKSISDSMPEALGKTFLLGKWRSDREIPDPYRQQRPAFEHVYKLMNESVSDWQKYI